MQTATTTDTNIELIQAAFADFGNGNIGNIIDNCTDDVTWGSYNNDKVPYATTYMGKAGVGQFFKNLAEAVDYKAFQPKEFYAAGDKVIAKVYHEATVRATGKTFGHDTMMEFSIIDDKISSFFAYVDSYEQAVAFSK